MLRGAEEGIQYELDKLVFGWTNTEEVQQTVIDIESKTAVDAFTLPLSNEGKKRISMPRVLYFEK